VEGKTANLFYSVGNLGGINSVIKPKIFWRNNAFAQKYDEIRRLEGIFNNTYLILDTMVKYWKCQRSMDSSCIIQADMTL
jgi:hypothetical protein